MIGLMQRVTHASVSVEGDCVSEIKTGLLVLVGVQRGDSRERAERLLQRLLGYRVFPDSAGRMNLSVADVDGGLLLVPQFTLAADTRKGARPSFASAASPDDARELFSYLLDFARARYANIGSGVFGADMQVSLVNDGPVTFWIEV